MNPNKICIIITYEDEITLESCIAYFNQQFIPEQFELELQTILQGTNYFSVLKEILLRTDAKYRIFLNSNVFVLYPFLVDSCLNIFKRDKEIGMIGMSGTDHIPFDGLLWKTMKKDLILQKDVQPDYNNCRYSAEKDGYWEAKIIDDIFFMTSYEFEIRTDLFSDSYLIGGSIALEMQKKGYKIVIPNHCVPWISCDNRYFSLNGYGLSRKIFFDEYWNELY